MSSPQVLFPVFLVVTVLLLGAVVATGVKGRVRPHLTFVVITVASLLTTIYFAEQLGELYDLKAAGRITPIHLTLAKLATVAYLGPTVTGWLTLRNRQHKSLHFRLAMVTLGLTIAAAITGTWMILVAEPLATTPS
ncbi:MAG: hypothetical protein IT454_18730 [Planctomycetes bacterium]|nr:hypothetical protein [Planctomycetota bacterium]